MANARRLGECHKEFFDPPRKETYGKVRLRRGRQKLPPWQKLPPEYAANCVGETAKALEFAARDNNAEFIREHHQPMMESYTELLEKLKAILNI